MPAGLMHSYDPEQAPLPWEWLALDEAERIRQVEAFHAQAGIKLPKLKAHAMFHAVVEKQIAENLAPVVQAMTRLNGEGLSRHEALHAIGFVLAGHLSALFNAQGAAADSQAAYVEALDKLTARSWREGGQGA